MKVLKLVEPEETPEVKALRDKHNDPAPPDRAVVVWFTNDNELREAIFPIEQIEDYELAVQHDLRELGETA